MSYAAVEEVMFANVFPYFFSGIMIHPEHFSGFSTRPNSLHPLCDIERHSVLHHMFADDTDLCNSTPRSSTDFLFCNVKNCVSDEKKCTIHKRLQLNEYQIEALLFDPSKSSDLPDDLKTGHGDIPFCNSAVGPVPVILSIAMCTTKTTHIVRKAAAFLDDTPHARASTCNWDAMYQAHFNLCIVFLIFITLIVYRTC